MSETPVRVRVRVHGRVQGVFFRDSCRHEARAAHIGGWVRNRRDGTVEAAFEGGRDAVERMVQWCHRGPPGAGVTQVDIVDEPPVGETTFRVAATG